MSLNILSLAHLKIETGAFPLPDRWLHSSDLALSGPSALELDTFTAALKCSGLSLTDARDTLTWVGGDGSGFVTAKNVYAALLPDRETDVQPLWLSRIWSWQLPLKYKLFLWLGVAINSSPGRCLQRKGRQGPGFCVLCRAASEILTTCLYIALLPKMFGCTSYNISLPFHWTGATFQRSVSPPGPLTWLRLLLWQFMSAGIYG
jgi:hypothetical protein